MFPLVSHMLFNLCLLECLVWASSSQEFDSFMHQLVSHITSGAFSWSEGSSFEFKRSRWWSEGSGTRVRVKIIIPLGKPSYIFQPLVTMVVRRNWPYLTHLCSSTT